MHHLDEVGRLVPSSRHLSLSAADRAAHLAALRDRDESPRDGGAPRRRRIPRVVVTLSWF